MSIYFKENAFSITDMHQVLKLLIQINDMLASESILKIQKGFSCSLMKILLKCMTIIIS